jgi:hypothetical protein
MSGVKLTEEEHVMLGMVALRPHGLYVRGAEEQRLVLSLARMGLVCDPHTEGRSLFTRITDAGRALLKEVDRG